MKKIFFLYALPVILMYSCIKHEIIPAPEKKVELKAYFKGYIDSTDVDWRQNINDYACEATNSRNVTQDPGKKSSAIFYAEMISPSVKGSIRLGIGSIYWNGIINNPTKEIFNTFMLNHTTPKYSTGAVDGVEIRFTDNFGKQWFSDSTSTDIEFTSMSPESDLTNDYMKFQVSFSCFVYRQIDEKTKDSIEIKSGVFKGWFQRL